MPTLNPKDAARLPKILGMLGSAHDGEILNAAKQARTLLTRSGMTWEDLFKGTGRGDIDAAFDRGYRRGMVDGAKAMKDQANRRRAYEENKPEPKPEPKAPGSTRQWPPDDDIWNSYLPKETIVGYDEQIDQLDALWAIEARLSDWEHGFVQSIAEQLIEKGSLTDRQCDKVTDVYERKVTGSRR